MLKKVLQNIFGSNKNPSEKPDYDNTALIQAYRLAKNSSLSYDEPNYALAEKVFKDFNNVQLKITESGLLPTYIPMSVLPYPKKYIKAAYYIYFELAAKNKNERVVKLIEEVGFLLFAGYVAYGEYKKQLQTAHNIYPSFSETFKNLFGVYEVSEEDYKQSVGAQDCTDEKIIHDFGYLPNIEEDVDFRNVTQEGKTK